MAANSFADLQAAMPSNVGEIEFGSSRIRIRELSASDQVELFDAHHHMAGDNDDDARAGIELAASAIIRAAINDQGEPLIPDDADGRAFLLGLRADVLQGALQAILEHSGIVTPGKPESGDSQSIDALRIA